MPAMGRIFSVCLWIVVTVMLVFSGIGVASTTGVLRISSVSDDSASPLIPSGSLDIAVKTLSKNVKKGDVILVGAHSDKGSTLGKVIALSQDRDRGVSVTLKAPNRSTPDQWNYELGNSTYSHVVAIPFAGKIFSLTNKILNPWIIGALAALFVWFILAVLRNTLFSPPEVDRDRWFKKINANDQDDVDALIEIFAEKSPTPLVPYVKKRRFWHAR